MLGWLDVAIRDFRFYFHICTKAWLAGEQFDPCHAQKIFRRNGQDVSELHALLPLVALIELSKAFPFSHPGIHLRLNPRPYDRHTCLNGCRLDCVEKRRATYGGLRIGKPTIDSDTHAKPGKNGKATDPSLLKAKWRMT